MTQIIISSMEVGEELAKESSFVYWNNAVYLDETALYGRDVTHKKTGSCK